MSERFGHNDEAWAKIADPSTICDRLRGQYNIPVNDGAGPLNGSMVFSRYFQTTPIQNAAADLIDQLQAQIAILTAENEQLRNDLREWAECCQIDTVMQGPARMGWNRSALKRCLDKYEFLQPKEGE